MKKTPVLDGLPGSAEAAAPARGNAPRHGFGVCPECTQEFERHQADKLFCCQKHRRDWNNRWVVRGAVLAPLAAVARATRNGSRGDKVTGAKASVDTDHLMRKWAREDKAEKRMTLPEYLRRRYAIGYDPI